MIENPGFYKQLQIQFTEVNETVKKNKLHYTQLLDSLIEKRKTKIKNENQIKKTKEFEKKNKVGSRFGLKNASDKKHNKFLENNKKAIKTFISTSKKDIETISIKKDRKMSDNSNIIIEEKTPETKPKKKNNNVYATMFDESSSSSDDDIFGSENNDTDSEYPESVKSNKIEIENSNDIWMENGPSEAVKMDSIRSRKNSHMMDFKKSNIENMENGRRYESDKVKRLKLKIEQMDKKKIIIERDTNENFFDQEREYLQAFQRNMLKEKGSSNVNMDKKRTWLEDFNPNGLDIFCYKYLEKSKSKTNTDRFPLMKNKEKKEGENMINKLENTMGVSRRELDVNLDLSLTENSPKKPNLIDLGLDFKNTNLTKACLNGYWDYREQLLSKTLPYIDLNDPYLRSLVENFNKQKLLGQRKEDLSKPTIYDITKNRSDAMQVKKQYRMIMAEINKGSSLDNIKDLKKLKDSIVYDRDCQIGNLLGFNKIEDFKENEEIIKNRKRRVKAIHHTPVADNFEHYDFVIKPEKVINLYR